MREADAKHLYICLTLAHYQGLLSSMRFLGLRGKRVLSKLLTKNKLTWKFSIYNQRKREKSFEEWYILFVKWIMKNKNL